MNSLLVSTPRDSQESSPAPQLKSINSSTLSLLYGPTLTSIMTTGKTIALTRRTFVGKVTSLLYNMLSGPGQDVRIWRCVYAKENKIFHLSFIYGMGMGADGFA